MPIKKNNKDYGTRVKVEEITPSLTTLNATANGEYTPTSPYNGYSSVTVNVTTPTEPFYVYDMSGTANTMTIKEKTEWETLPIIEVFYSYDKSTWTSLGTTSATPLTLALPNDGSKVYLRATCDRWGGLNYGSSINLNCNKDFAIGGNIMSLLYGANYEGATFTSDNAHAFQYVFSELDSTIYLDAGDLILPSNTIDHCYDRLFMGRRMRRAPKLPATSLTRGCYMGMFQYGKCPLTIVLPATTLAIECYEFMFYQTKEFHRIVSYAQDISATDCTDSWVVMVDSTGDFYNLGGAQFPSSVSGIPSGWAVHTSL